MAESADRTTVTKMTRDAGVDLAELRQDVEAGLVGKAEVEENDVRKLSGDLLQAFRGGASNLDTVCRGGKQVGHPLRQQVRVVVDQQ